MPDDNPNPNPESAASAPAPLIDLQETVAAEPEKLAAFLTQPDKCAGQKFYPFSAGRRIVLSITRNEFYFARKHVETFLRSAAYPDWWQDYQPAMLAEFDRELAKLQTGPADEKPAALAKRETARRDMEQARQELAERERPLSYEAISNLEFMAICPLCVPEYELHIGELAFICTHDSETLADLSADGPTFRRAVLNWLDQFTIDQLEAIRQESLRRYANENIGRDYEVETTDGTPARPN